MINFTEHLYSTQWLDLVFQNRNKSYGAYELRKNNAVTTTRAFLVSCTLFCLLVITLWAVRLLSDKNPPTATDQLSNPIEVSLMKVDPVKSPPPPSAASAPRQNMKSVRYTVMTVSAAESVIEPPTQEEIATSIIGTENNHGENGTELNSPPDLPHGDNGSSAGVSASDTEAVFSPDLIEKFPEFPGGNEAFAKYLRRNLRYPLPASENGIQGRVIVSFVVEKNGDLSNIRILRGIGAGCDEEAMRVLSNSPAWKPGIQNNLKVRVAYTIPIVFRLP